MWPFASMCVTSDPQFCWTPTLMLWVPVTYETAPLSTWRYGHRADWVDRVPGDAAVDVGLPHAAVPLGRSPVALTPGLGLAARVQREARRVAGLDQQPVRDRRGPLRLRHAVGNAPVLPRGRGLRIGAEAVDDGRVRAPAASARESCSADRGATRNLLFRRRLIRQPRRQRRRSIPRSTYWLPSSRNESGTN